MQCSALPLSRGAHLFHCRKNKFTVFCGHSPYSDIRQVKGTERDISVAISGPSLSFFILRLPAISHYGEAVIRVCEATKDARPGSCAVYSVYLACDTATR